MVLYVVSGIYVLACRSNSTLSDEFGTAQVNVRLATTVPRTVLGRTILVYVPGPTEAPSAAPTLSPTPAPTPNVTTGSPVGGGGGSDLNATLAPTTVSGGDNSTTSQTATPTTSGVELNSTAAPSVSEVEANATGSPTTGGDNTTALSTGAPTVGGGASNTQSPTAGPDITFFATAGWMANGDRPCAVAPWTFIDTDGSTTTVNTSCVPFSVLEPYMGGGQTPALPEKEDADVNMWCPTVDIYRKEPPVGQRPERKFWGYCLPVEDAFGSRRVLEDEIFLPMSNRSTQPGACGKIIPQTGPVSLTLYGDLSRFLRCGFLTCRLASRQHLGRSCLQDILMLKRR